MSSTPRLPQRGATTQAALLKMRGDLRRDTEAFDARLASPSAIAAPIRSGDGVSRIGMELERSDSGAHLVVGRVDEDPRRRTPAARWNLDARRRSVRVGRHRYDEDEVTAALDLRRGDRIAAVNGAAGEPEALAAELARAMSQASPKAITLTVQREQCHEPVLKPVVAAAPRAATPRARRPSCLRTAGSMLTSSTSSSAGSSLPSSRDEGSISSGESTCASFTVAAAARRLRSKGP